MHKIPQVICLKQYFSSQIHNSYINFDKDTMTENKQLKREEKNMPIISTGNANFFKFLIKHKKENTLFEVHHIYF